jgi:hypothetical protein
VHFLKYDTGEFPENLQTCDWELDANEGGKDASRATKSAGAARALDIKGASGDSKSSAESGSRLADRAAAPVQDPRKSKEGKSSRDSKGQHASGSAGKTGADAVGAEAASGKCRGRPASRHCSAPRRARSIRRLHGRCQRQSEDG